MTIMRNMTTVTINGKEYKGRKDTYKCTAYTACPAEGGYYSYSGKRLKKGMIAADLKVLPLGTKVYIPYFDMVFTVEDTGSAIRNKRLDILMNTKAEAWDFGIRNLEIIILD
jgi:3D (Asp-Asp-Asp) domain-containing protein